MITDRQFLLCKRHQVGPSNPQQGIAGILGTALVPCCQNTQPRARPSAATCQWGATTVFPWKHRVPFGTAEEHILGGYCEVLLEKASSWMSVEQLRQDLTPYRVPGAYIKQLIKLVIIPATLALGVSGHVEDTQKQYTCWLCCPRRGMYSRNSAVGFCWSFNRYLVTNVEQSSFQKALKHVWIKVKHVFVCCPRSYSLQSQGLCLQRLCWQKVS